MNYSCFLDDKSDALRLDEKQHRDIKYAQVELLAKIRNHGNPKLRTPNRKLEFAVSHENPDAKGLYHLNTRHYFYVSVQQERYDTQNLNYTHCYNSALFFNQQNLTVNGSQEKLICGGGGGKKHLVGKKQCTYKLDFRTAFVTYFFIGENGWGGGGIDQPHFSLKKSGLNSGRCKRSVKMA